MSKREIVGSVRRHEVLAILRSLLIANSVFPPEGREGFVYEGATIGLASSGVQIMLSRADVIHPQRIAERRIERYEDLDAAVEAFVDLEWSQGIDGIPIDPSA